MPISGPSPLAVVFTDTSSDATAWSWLFGDGNVSILQNPTNTYTAEGVYTVYLIATTPSGDVTFSDVVTVDDDLPGTTYTAPSPTHAVSQGTDPQVMLRISNDGGKTWVAEAWRSAGKAGEYLRRVRWNRLGCARRRVFEVTVTDPIPWKLTGCYVEMEPEAD